MTGAAGSIVETDAKRLNPILKVSDIVESFAWFEKFGWKKSWDWGHPPTFGGVCSGECEIFLCQNGQGGRGKGDNNSNVPFDGRSSADKGVWISVWLNDLDSEYRNCIAQGLEVMWPPTNHPWGAREMHVCTLTGMYFA